MICLEVRDRRIGFGVMRVVGMWRDLNWRSRLELQLARQKLGADWIILELVTT